MASVSIPLQQMIAEEVKRLLADKSPQEIAQLGNVVSATPPISQPPPLPAALPAKPNDTIFDGFTDDVLYSKIVPDRPAPFFPLISCVMLYSDKGQFKSVRSSLSQFLAQSYPNKELIIVNTTGSPIAVSSGSKRPVVREILKNSGLTDRQKYRDFGIAAAEGSWIFPTWDDADSYDPNFLMYLAGHITPEVDAVFLSRQLRVHLQHSVMFCYHRTTGIHGTGLFRRERTANVYDPLALRESVCIANNSSFPLNCLHVSVYYRKPEIAFEAFMDGRTGPEWQNRFELNPAEREYGIEVLRRRGVGIAPVPAEKVPGASA